MLMFKDISLRVDRTKPNPVTQTYTSSMKAYHKPPKTGSHLNAYKEVSRRELRKAIERQCGSATFRETELLVLCDSLDAGHRGRISLSDIKDSLRGTSSSKGGRHPIGGVGHGAATREWVRNKFGRCGLKGCQAL